ncbi:plasmodesmata-located protein 3-like isoform X1 [Coffea arabica]|uniref:Plasmodesmata-located protein 3-like isoform X1 n=1 Tax=Coffea arabica TaxID=13443 RepID=A0ABM4X230_COFAR
MGSSCILSILLLTSFINLGFSADYTSLVYKGCADQKFQDPTGDYSRSLENLLDTLTSRSSSTKFYKATSGQGQSAITGLFQCRGDLSSNDCNNCVKRTPDVSRRLCGNAIAVRVQLGGCYLRYEASGFRQVSATELLFKICGSTQASGSGFQDRLDAALGEIGKGVGSSGNGFYTGGYQSVYVLGQCEGDLASGDCADCVKAASQRAKSECPASISAQIYLQQCYVSYTYYPNGVPPRSLSSSGSGGTGPNTQKTVAIVLGGTVGVGLVIAVLSVVRSALNKKGRPKYTGDY